MRSGGSRAVRWSAGPSFDTDTGLKRSPAPNTLLQIIETGGGDLNPLNPTKAKDFQRLRACIWPDHSEGMGRPNRATLEQNTKIFKDGAQE